MNFDVPIHCIYKKFLKCHGGYHISIMVKDKFLKINMCLHDDNPSSYADGQNNESNQNIGKLKWLVDEFCRKGV